MLFLPYPWPGPQGDGSSGATVWRHAASTPRSLPPVPTSQRARCKRARAREQPLGSGVCLRAAAVVASGVAARGASWISLFYSAPLCSTFSHSFSNPNPLHSDRFVYKRTRPDHQVLACLDSVLRTDPHAEARRAAVTVHAGLLRGLGRGGFDVLGEALTPTVRLLREVCCAPIDSHCQLSHARHRWPAPIIAQARAHSFDLQVASFLRVFQHG